MPSFFHKPENALKRAREFIEVGKAESGLEVLNDVIRSRKHRQKWTDVHERIMLLYTELCVQLQRSSYAKDGLYQYRNICKEVAPNSFEKVIKSFLKMAEDKANKARQESEATVLQEVEDLDAVVTPESLLLSTVSGEGAKERTDRVLLTPWVKFLWESYRNMLELLKNNLVTLSVYSDVAKSAFKFCLNYQRRMEFRKLCDILRNHLSQAEKYQSQQHTLKLDQPEVIQGLVDVRFEQLESSIAVDMWQEAFRAIEEIHKLLSMSGKTPKPSLLENFYSRQAKVFMMAKNQLFHAAALHKLFVLRKEQKKTLTKDEAVLTASQVLLATLAVPIEPIPSEADRFLEVDDNSRDKARRLAALLRMDTPPTRATLMRDVLKQDVLQLLSPELQKLYDYLEMEFEPLCLSSKVMPILDGLDEHEALKQYVEPLKEIVLVRLVKQVSQVYESIELSRLVELAPFATTTDLEKIVVETATTNNIQVRIDHSTKSLRFGTNMNFSHQLDSPEGPHVQNMPSEILCSQLTMMSQALQQAVHIISATDLTAEQQALAKKACQNYQVHSRSDIRRAMQRSADIEARKEFIENKRKAIDKKREAERRQKEQQERSEEKERLDREAKQREKERRMKEIEEMTLKMKQEKLDALKNTAVGKRAFADITNEDLKNMDADVIFSKQLKQIEKEKRDKEMKLKAQEKKIDYFERARRLVELPILEKQYQEQRKTDKEFHIEQEDQAISQAIQEREEGLEASARLTVMRADEARFREILQKRRKSVYLEKMAVFQEKLDSIKAERLAQRRRERMEKRRAEYAAAKKEEEARQAVQKREEEERRREEEKKKREEEREKERQAIIKREEELEEKIKRKEREALEELSRQKRGPVVADDGDWRRKGGDREQEEPRAAAPPQRGGGGGAYRPPAYRGRDSDPYDSPRRERRLQEDGPSFERGGGGGGGGGSWRSRNDEEPFQRGRDEGESWRGGDDRGMGRRDELRHGEREDGGGWGSPRSRRGYAEDRDRGGRSRGYDGERRGYDSGRRGYDGESRREDDHWRRDEDGDRGRRDDRGRDWDRDRRPRDSYDRDSRRRGDYDRDFDHDRRPRDYDRDRRPGPAYDRDRDRDGRRDFDRDRGPPSRDYDQDRGPPREREYGRDGGRAWGRGDGDRWRDRDEKGGGGGDRWKDRHDARDVEGLKAGDWRGRDGDRSPGRGDRGRDASPRHQHDEDGFEMVTKRR